MSGNAKFWMGNTPVLIRYDEDDIVIDFGGKDQRAFGAGPRVWFERGKNDLGEGLKIMVHANGDEDPTHCVFIPDTHPNVPFIYPAGDKDWPLSLHEEGASY